MRDLRLVTKSKERDYQAYGIIGGKGQGKSSFIAYMIDQYILMHKNKTGLFPRVFVHDISSSRAFADYKSIRQLADIAVRNGYALEHPLDVLGLKTSSGSLFWKAGCVKYESSQEEAKLVHQKLNQHFTDGVVVLDEVSSYVNDKPTWEREILIKHRNRRVELILVFHELLRVPPFYVRGQHLSKLVLFKTGEDNVSLAELRRKYSKADRIFKAHEDLKKKKKTNYIIQPYKMIDIQ